MMKRICFANFEKISLFFMVLLLGILTPCCAYSQEVVEETPAIVKETKARTQELVYSPLGRRDPFVPLVQEIKKINSRPAKERGPLEKFELGQFRLLAMLIVKGIPRAMVKAPDGKSYTVKPGDPIGKNGGIITKIETKKMGIDPDGQRIEKSPDRIVVKETGVDSYTGKVVTDYRYIVM